MLSVIKAVTVIELQPSSSVAALDSDRVSGGSKYAVSSEVSE